jgi:hypothetical protein
METVGEHFGIPMNYLKSKLKITRISDTDKKKESQLDKWKKDPMSWPIAGSDSYPEDPMG